MNILNENFADVSMIVGLSGVGIMILIAVLALVYFLVWGRWAKKDGDSNLPTSNP